MVIALYILTLLILPLGYRFRAAIPEQTTRRMLLAFGLVLLSKISAIQVTDYTASPWILGATLGIQIIVLMFSSGILFGTIFRGARKRFKKLVIILATLALTLHPLSFLSGVDRISYIPVLLLACFTGWTRETRGGGRLFLTLLSFLLFIISIPSYTWPQDFSASFRALIETLESISGLPAFFLAVHSFLASFRLAFGFKLEVRKIGRRLIVSHLLAILVPAILTIAFIIMTSMASIASYRAESAGRHLVQQKIEKERDLGRLLAISAPLLDATPGHVALEQTANGLLAQFDEIGGGAALLTTTTAEGAIGSSILSLTPSAAAETTGGPSGGWVIPIDTWLTRPASNTGLAFAEGKLFSIAHASTPLGSGGDSLHADLIHEIPEGRLRDLEETFATRITINPLITVNTNDGGVQIGSVDNKIVERTKLERERWGGEEDEESRKGTIPGATLVDILEYNSEQGRWSERAMVLSSRSHYSDLFTGLTSFRENRINLIPMVFLVLIAILFLIVVGFVIGTVIFMNRAIAGSIGRLTTGARHLRDGELAHRIETKGTDELEMLAREFNRMAEGLEDRQRLALENERVEQELAIAKEIQRKLLPDKAPELPGLEIAGFSTPAREVGGDYYDYILSGDGGFTVAIADVSGKGVPAALLMSSLRASLRAQIHDHCDPAPTMERLNSFIYSSTKVESFVTGFLCVIDGGTGEVRFANAGHEPPLVLRANGTIDTIDGGGLILGAFPTAPYEEVRLTLEPGDLMLLYTDGVTEAMNVDEEFYGMERIIEYLGSLVGSTASDTLSAFASSVNDFTAGAEQSDDITLVAVKRI